MVRRHPHVFNSVKVSGSAEVVRNWEQIKAAEAQGKRPKPSLVDAIGRLPKGLPALISAQRIGEKAAQAGFERSSLDELLDKARRDWAALEDGIQCARSDSRQPVPETLGAAERLPDELRTRLECGLGELLFALCQIARWLGVGAEDGLRAASKRFIDRFQREKQQTLDESQQPRLGSAQ
jgi:tetrapyrrole methylase family protein / MazG family protein